MRPTLTSIGSLPPGQGPPDQAILAAVQLQRTHGLELLTDGEQRFDMLSSYGSLPGIRTEGGVPRIVSRIRPLEDPGDFVKVRDLEFLQSRFPDLAFKVSLTGPTTFVFSCATTGAGPAYRSALDPALHDDLTEAIRPIAHEIGRRGAHLQLDDPILSQGMRDYAPALRRLGDIASEVPREKASLHVCGGLVRSKLLPSLLGGLQSVSTLHLAFAGRAERENLALLEPGGWDESDMYLGAGCIDVQVSRADQVAPSRDVASLLRVAAERIGRERIRFVVPDCGLRATPSDAVPRILDNLRQGFLEAFPESH